MTIQRIAVPLAAILFSLPALAQSARGVISGTVTDVSGAVLPGARIELAPEASPAVSNAQGQFFVPNLAPGTYAVTVSYVGFEPYSTTVTIAAGQTTMVTAVMPVAAVNQQQVIVYAGRSHGEAEAINEIRTSPNILNVLPADVITSLPNANIADAVGRLPGVTLERDEGEGKYVQIRGTEPRLSNTTIDGINVPSPESGVRQVKLDTIPSDLVESVQINKTLSANQDGDAIGGSVNLVTKTAGEAAAISAYGTGGFTPIFDTPPVSEFGITAGKRFGTQKRIGVLGGFTYDYNGRGIDDIEPSPTSDSLAPSYDSIDMREYRYDRSRYGIIGTVDYKVNEGSDVAARFLYSDFKDYGDRWVYTLNNGDVPSFNVSRRLPDYAIGDLAISGKQLFTSSWLTYEVSVARARQAAAAGNPGASFDYSGNPDVVSSICTYDPAATISKYRPQFDPACTAAGSPVFDPTQYTLSELDATQGQTTQLNLQANTSYARNYHAGSHFGTFELGFKIRNEHKGQFAFSPAYIPNDNFAPEAQLMSNFLNDVHNNRYYGGSYRLGPFADYNRLIAFQNANPDDFSTDEATTHLNSDASNFNLDERITAGYLMNTIEFGKFRLQTGLRFEGTNLSTTGYQVNLTPLNPDGSGGDYLSTTPIYGTGSYLDVLPSVQLHYAITPETAIRAVFGRGISRPNPQDLIPSVTLDQSTNPYTYSLGNPNLKAEHGNDYDLLFEKFFSPLGLLQAGFFYKDLGDPIISIRSKPTTGQFAGFLVQQPTNAGSAYVTGVEIAYQQRLSYLPGRFGGLGFSGNYSYTASQASGVDPLRTDKPALLRQAPNTWNLSPTYDQGPLSVRLGIAYNGPNIYQYQYENLQYQDGTTQTAPIDPPPTGGLKGPAGDNYLYAHAQVDAQIMYRLPAGFTALVSGLNLTNEVFGFYNGSTQYVVQREYYKPTYSAGIRWTSNRER
jgi:TonB-dependent receptor